MSNRLRKNARWFLLGVSALFLSVLAFSFVRRLRIDTGFTSTQIERGTLNFYNNGLNSIYWGYAIVLEPLDPDGGIRLLPELRSVDGSTDIKLPLWIPIFLLAAPTLLLWMQPIRSFRRRRKGHCIKCGYPLQSRSRPCPECGAPARTPSKS